MRVECCCWAPIVYRFCCCCWQAPVLAGAGGQGARGLLLLPAVVCCVLLYRRSWARGRLHLHHGCCCQRCHDVLLRLFSAAAACPLPFAALPCPDPTHTLARRPRPSALPLFLHTPAELIASLPPRPAAALQVAPTDIEEGMRVGVDRQKYQIQVRCGAGAAFGASA